MFFEPEFWVAIAFLILMGVFAYLGVHRTVLRTLDHRSERIKAELDDACRLKEEAAKLLADYQARRASAEREAEDIIANARADAERIAAEAAIAAGSASALMFASIISGALISLLLFYLAPLPLMVAALGWGPLGATIGGIVAAIGLGAIFGLPYCIAFAVTVALPAWWLGHLARLGRPMINSVSPGNGASPVAP